MHILKNSKLWYFYKQHRIANYLFNINPMFVSLTTHNWEQKSCYISFIYNHAFLFYYQAWFSRIYCSKRKMCKKQISTSMWAKRKLPWLFQVKYNLVLIFDFECISMYDIWNKFHLLFSFDERLKWNFKSLFTLVTIVTSSPTYVHNLYSLIEIQYVRL